MERLHNQDNPARKSRTTASQQTIIVNSDEEALATLQCKKHRIIQAKTYSLCLKVIITVNVKVSVVRSP